ncbi:uncharacterized protein DUF1049 [Tahibacter aquaticus]|uniref:Uncharacterized protein DUF1049 n=1 Tax=Tahibacter aquaticus TaxID=520092 RepID=A0A4R6YNI0_9GAMM|nr:DUF1049 domain-containing protein [Tahibacter aquaticus]TDR39170.1 uncharacterized protein DUF1049 [Tahibacter aquaticus]
MRVVWTIVALLFVIAGALFGALNSEQLSLDFYAVQLSLPKGAALLAAVLFGWLVGGLVLWLAVVVPLKRRFAQQRRDHARREPVPVVVD